MRIGSIVIRCHEFERMMAFWQEARLVGIGARRYPWRHAPDDDFVVLADPEGNLFCVVQVPADA